MRARGPDLMSGVVHFIRRFRWLILVVLAAVFYALLFVAVSERRGPSDPNNELAIPDL
jgi:hypothetical protein